MSQAEDEKEEKENPYWAPTNFTDWDNDYRLPAVLSFCIFFGAIILWVIIGWPVFKKIRKNLEETGNKEGFETISSSTNCFFGFLPFGVCLVQQNRTSPTKLRLIISRLCCCRKREVIEFDRTKASLTLKRHYCNPLQWCLAFVFGFSFSFFGHFIPCIWWTCDWGPEDGEQIRGLIWFIGWPSFTLLFLLLGMFCLYLHVEAEGISSCCCNPESYVWVSVGNNHYCRKPKNCPKLLQLMDPEKPNETSSNSVVRSEKA